MTTVDCILKVSDTAEPYMTKFDLDTGRVVDDISWMSSIPVKKTFDIYGAVYSNTILSDIYYDVAFKFRNARLIINYKGIGFILVFDTAMVLCNTELAMYGDIVNLDQPLIKTDIFNTGCVLTPAFTVDVMHPASKLAVIQEDNQVYIMTRYGLRRLSSEYTDIFEADESVRITPSILLDTSDGLYAGYSIKGKTKFINLKEVKL